jgi:hypothetical protein
MKSIVIKLVLFAFGLLALISLNFLPAEERAGCPTAKKCIGSVYTSCRCPDGNCGGCLRRQNGTGCGVCAKCKSAE